MSGHGRNDGDDADVMDGVAASSAQPGLRWVPKKMSPDEIYLFEREVLYGLVVGDSVTVQGFTFKRQRTPGHHTLFVQRVKAHPLDPGRTYAIGEVTTALSDVLYILQQGA
jgi:hypothetical protein